MPTYGDIRQQTVLAIESQGADALTIVRDGIRAVKDEIGVLNQQQAEGMGPREYINHLNRLAAELGKLEKMETELTQVMAKEVRERIDLIAREERARMDAAKSAEQAAGDALRARIDAVARAERVQEQADSKAKQDAGDAMRERIDAIARLERAQEAASRAAIQAAGDEKRARIEAYAAEERAIESTAKKQAAADESIKQQIGDLKRQRIEAYAAADQAVMRNHVQTTAATREQIEGLKIMGIIKDDDTKKSKKQGEEGQKAGQAAARGVLELSRAVEDFAVAGPLGALNNIPGIVYNVGQAFNLSAGAVAGWTAGISLASTAAYVLWNNWETFVSAMQGGLPPKMLKDVKDLEEGLRKLESITVKTDVDYINITNARVELDRLKEEEGAYNRVKGQKTEEQQRRSDVITKAVVESGGGDDFKSSAENIQDAIFEKMAADSPDVKRQREYIAERKRRLESPELDDAAKNRAASDLRGATGILDAHLDAIRKKAKGIVGGAVAGRELETRQLSEFFGANEQNLSERGVDTLRLGAGLENASKDNLFADERRKLAKEGDDKAKAAWGKRAAELKQRTDQDAARVGPGVDDQLQKTLFDAIKGGTTPEAAMHGQRAGLIHTLRGRDVGEDVVSDVAAKILEKAAAQAQNLISEGKKPTLDVKSDLAKAKAKAAADTAGAEQVRINDRIKAKRDKAVKEAAQRFGPGVDEALEQASLGHFMAGAGAAASAARLRPQLQARLKAHGAPADIVNDVAEKILEKAMDKVGNQLTEETMKRGIGTREAAARIRQVAQDKFQAGDMADERRAGAPQRQGQQQMGQQQRAYMAHLKTQALMESVVDGFGPAMQELAQIEEMNRQLQSKVRAMGLVNGRMGMQGRTFYPFGGG